jgi:hypothetical protein
MIPITTSSSTNVKPVEADLSVLFAVIDIVHQ